MENIQLFNGDCLEVMDKLIEQGVKVDMILTDPPYGTTDCKWDNVIPFDEMWKKLDLLIKDDTAIVMFGNEPFSSKLRLSNLEKYKYDWKWDKIQGANFLNVKYQPLKNIEDIMVFSNGRITNGKRKPIKYYPQNAVFEEKDCVNNSDSSETIQNSSIKKGKGYKTVGSNFPKCIIKFKKDKTKLHPTQKPIDLLEYLIKTYTLENEIVLDFTMGSGSTGIACLNTNRKFIGIELNEKYFEIAKNRIEEALKNN